MLNDDDESQFVIRMTQYDVSTAANTRMFVLNGNRLEIDDNGTDSNVFSPPAVGSNRITMKESPAHDSEFLVDLPNLYMVTVI